MAHRKGHPKNKKEKALDKKGKAAKRKIMKNKIDAQERKRRELQKKYNPRTQGSFSGAIIQKLIEMGKVI